jgi:predicted amidohydrolase YtcJ
LYPFRNSLHFGLTISEYIPKWLKKQGKILQNDSLESENVCLHSSIRYLLAMSDTIFYNGTIHTLDPRFPRAEALAVKNARIVAVGKRSEIEQLVSPNAKRIDLQGRTLLPGFNDAHVHVWKVGHLLTGLLDLRQVASIEALKSKLADFGKSMPTESWILGRGFNEVSFAGQRLPTRDDLDEVFPNRPVYLLRTCAHIAVANSKALAMCGINSLSQNPAGGVVEKDARGKPTGILHETAIGLVSRHLPSPSTEEYSQTIRAGMQHLLSLGIASATDPGVSPDVLRVYKNMDTQGELRMRLNVMATRLPDGGEQELPLPEKYCSDFLRIDTVKFFADGGLSGATAALHSPYRHKNTKGVLRLQRDRFFELAAPAHEAGLRIATHAIGDAAIALVLDVYQNLYHRDSGQRHRIEHCGLPAQNHLQSMRKNSIFAVPQPIFLYELGVNFRKYLPEKLLDRCYPIKSILNAGVDCAFSSDAPVVQNAFPLAGIKAAVLRQDREGQPVAPNEAISVENALKACTIAGALASGDENNRGSLTPGKWADMVVLSENPLLVQPENLDGINVKMTFVGGKCV